MIFGIIPAAGSGTRMRLSSVAPAKQFLPFGEGSVLTTTVQAMWHSALFDGLVIVVPEDDVSAVQAGLATLPFARNLHVVAGGKERQDSVRNGLNVLPDNVQYVVVHDGVRPLASPSLFKRVVSAAKVHGAAIPALPVSDTVKRTDDESRIVATVDRENLWLVQTPQAFKRDLLETAYERALASGLQVTDDAGLVEYVGASVHVIPGEPRNIKLTRVEDLELANAWAKERESSALRVGIGYDVHRLVPDRPLILGGVTVPHSLGLLGHSDADVLTHAIMDALLGAASLGDIGQHFPDTDPTYKDASSIELLRRVVDLLNERGYQPHQVDSVIAAQRPRLAPFIQPIKESLADALQLPVDAVGVKATTAEGLGFVGREEGMEARVVVTIRDYP